MNRIFYTPVQEGEVALSLLNTYSTLVIKTEKTTTIFDPIEINLRKENKIDIIVITHEHSDHFDQALVSKLRRENHAPILTTPFVAEVLGGTEEDVKPLRAGESFGLRDVGIHSEHSNHTGNQPLSFVICTDAANIYHPNDSRPFPEMDMIGKKYRPELMVYTGNLVGLLPEIQEMIRPQIILSYPDLRFEEMILPEVEIKILKYGEVYRYPFSRQ